ncbi:MAG: hypothetical protein LRY55_00480 [Leadbetterella sp.]|nr:hypothetical protein [Leadbetterella sp.]
MKRTQIFRTLLALSLLPFISCNTSNIDSAPDSDMSFVKLHVNGRLAYETDIVNAYYMASPLSILSLASVKDKNSGGAGPQFVFESLAFDGTPGTLRIVYGDGNKAAFTEAVESVVRYDISNRDAAGNRGYLDVTITGMRRSGTVQVLTGTFSGKLINDKKRPLKSAAPLMTMRIRITEIDEQVHFSDFIILKSVFKKLTK